MAQRSFLGAGVSFEIDTSDFLRVAMQLKKDLSEANFKKLMNRTLGEVARKAKSLMGNEVVKDYNIPKSWFTKQVMRYRLNGLTCVIPIRGYKGIIGARFPIVNGSGTKGAPITAKILTSQNSTLPPRMKNQGGNPPILMYVTKGVQGAHRKKMGRRDKVVVMTRKTQARLPLVRVAGLAAPQMALNQSADDIQEVLVNYAIKRLENNFNHMFGG